MMYLYYKIPLKPVSKKNSLQIAYAKGGKPFIVQSPQYKKYERAVKGFLPPMDKPISEPVNIKYTYWFKKNKDGSVPKTKVDLTNLMNATDDLLVKYGILEDDNCQIVQGHDGSRVYYTSAGEECTEIEIQSFFIATLD